MRSLISIFVDICLLRKGPQDLPASTTLTALAVLLSVVMGVWVEALLGEREHLLARPMVSTSGSLAFVFVILGLRGLKARFRQTWTAFAGAGALLTVAFVPVLWSVSQAAQTQQSLNPIAYLAFLFLTLWSFVIDAHIFRHALSVSFTVGFLFATIGFAVVTALRWYLFPP